ncbi:MAG: HAD-IC family P-type ATPase [Alcanivoracaceae bacterium]|nr:HAD-IC family P-type ATPase [Alcanivoracaceae bacterium]
MTPETLTQAADAAHAQTPEQSLAALSASRTGLTAEQVTARRNMVGENRLPQPQVRAWYLRLLAQFNNALLYVLLVSAVITLSLGYHTDAGVIVAVVVINALVGFIQEGRAEAALRSILSMVVSQVLVRRDGHTRQVPVEALVPGDIVLINAGDRLPADVRLLEARELRCDEAALTGESLPVDKHIAAVPIDAPLAERTGCAFMGTQVTAGGGLGVVIATGLDTQLGRIGEMVKSVDVPVTPLNRQLERFARGLSLAIVMVTVLAMFWGVYVTGLSWPDMFRAAVGIAVAAIPEGLPAVVTISLAIGVQRMARTRALVRKLPAVEVLGSVTVICSDKTGTLTRNEMTARELVLADAQYTCSGEGYSPAGDVLHNGALLDTVPEDLHALGRAALFCNDASVAQEGGQSVLHGDPTEGALYVLAHKLGVYAGRGEEDWHRLDIIPFSTEKRFMAVLGHGREHQAMVYAKGAPERILAFCDHQLRGTETEPLDTQYWHSALAQLADDGMRVMALAMKAHDPDDATLSEDELDSDMIFLGLVGITDPPRHEAREAIRQCRDAGIAVKMITGDNPRTAAAIGAQLGLDSNAVMTGNDLAQLDDGALQEVVSRTAIFARTSPADKLRLVSALQQADQLVAMTGDGVNDAPALRRANIGVAMGMKGTDAAREAAAMVLTDDNFATITDAVREGRTVYDNIVKAILFVLPTSLVEAAVLLMAILLAVAMPVTPVQVLWVNMITAVTLAIALAFEPGEPDIMQRQPRRPGRGLITGLLLRRLLLIGLVGTAAVFWMFVMHQQDVDRARTLAVTTLVLIEVFYLFSCRRLYVAAWANAAGQGIWPALVATVLVLLLQFCFTVLPVMQHLFGTVALSAAQWGLCAATALVVVLVVELDKQWLSFWRRRRMRQVPQ